MISASKVELAATCAASMVLPQTQEKHVGQDEGNARHDVLDISIKAGEVPDVLEQRWPGYTWRSEVAFAIDLATGIGRELGVRMHRDYGSLTSWEIPGTADLIGRGPDGELAVVDRKSFDPNVSRAAVNGQLHTLALMACRTYDVSFCDVAIWHEVRPLDVSIVEPWDLQTYNDELLQLLKDTARARAEFRKTGMVAATPGQHCRWCAAFQNCVAQNALVTKVRTGVIGTRVEAMLPLASNDEAVKAYDLLEGIKMISKRLSGVLAAYATEHPIELPDGRVYGPRPVSGPRQINGDRAYELIREQYGQAVADAAVTRDATQVSIKAAFKAAGLKPEPETKKLMTALDEVGAVTQKDSVKIEAHLPRVLKAGAA